MYSTEPPDGSSAVSTSFHAELVRILNDPKVQRLALHRAGSRDLAEDALQEAFYSVARVKDPQHIENLRAFFCKALIHVIGHLSSQLAQIRVEDPESLTGYLHQGAALFGPAAPSTVEEEAVMHILAEARYTRFHRQRGRLKAIVPERSSDPKRYQEVVVAVAEEILRTVTDGPISGADSNKALQEAYPDWFGEPGCAMGTCYQRLSRARRDVRAVLKAVFDRAELSA